MFGFVNVITKMKLLLLVVLFRSIYCSENDDLNEGDYKERHIFGGTNYEGFVGNSEEAFLVKRKFETDNQDDRKLNGRELKNNDQNVIAKYKTSRYETMDNGDFFGYAMSRDYCTGENREIKRYRTLSDTYRQSPDAFDDESRNRCDRLFGFTGPTANDEPDNLVRPCALDDWQCIRNYFAANSNCKPAYGPIPDPLYIDINTVFYTIINVTASLPNLMIRGLSSAKITEFYVNKMSGNLVIAFDVTNLNESSSRGYFRYRRTAKESIVLADFASVNFRIVTLTAVIPNIPHMRLDLADIHAEVQDTTPVFFIGPGAVNSTDTDVITAFAQLSTFLPFVVREGFFFQSQLFASIYIQKNICDFGLKLISV